MSKCYIHFIFYDINISICPFSLFDFGRGLLAFAMRRALCLLGSLAGFADGISLQFGGSDFPSLPDAKEFNTGDLAIEKFLVQMDMAILTESKKEGQVCVCV